MNDFATDEFLNKNIRVRPVSGVTKAEDDAKTNVDFSHFPGKMDQPDEEEKFNKMINIDMEE